MTYTVNTNRGVVQVEPDVPLSDLVVGDMVVSMLDDVPVRTVYRVTHRLGNHRVPAESVTRIERVLDAVLRFGDRMNGVLVENRDPEGGDPTPALFAQETTPVLDRVII
jgi:hypothetical protein